MFSRERLLAALVRVPVELRGTQIRCCPARIPLCRLAEIVGDLLLERCGRCALRNTLRSERDARSPTRFVDDFKIERGSAPLGHRPADRRKARIARRDSREPPIFETNDGAEPTHLHDGSANDVHCGYRSDGGGV